MIIDNRNDARIIYINYVTYIALIRNSGLKFIKMVLLDFKYFL